MNSSRVCAIWFFMFLCSFPALCAQYDEKASEELDDYLSELAIASKATNQRPDKTKLRRIEEFLRFKADPSTANKDNGATVLHFVAEAGLVDLLTNILQHQVNIDAKTKENRTPLMYAGANGHKEIVKILIEKNADVDAKDDNDHTALIYASYNGHKEVVDILICLGCANIECIDRSGMTALLNAADNESEEVVKLLIGFGAQKSYEIFQKANSKIKKLLSPFFIEEKKLGRDAKLRQILRLGNNKELEIFLRQLQKEKITSPLDESETNGFRPLDITLVRRYHMAFIILLNHGADPTLCHFSPRKIKGMKRGSSRDLSLHYANYDYSRKHYFPLIALAMKGSGIPFEVIKYIVQILLLE